MAVILVSTLPASGAPSSILNGSFETGADLDTTFDGWTALNQRIDLGVTTIAGCTSVDTSNYSNFSEYFTEAGKEYFLDFEIQSDSTGDYELFLNDSVEVTAASVNVAGNEITYTSENSFQVGDLVRVRWVTSAPGHDVEVASVSFANATTFKVTGDFSSIDGETVTGEAFARSYVTALGLPFGYRDFEDVETAFLQLNYPTSPSDRVYEQDWTSAQRTAVTALVRDPVASNDSLVFSTDGAPEFTTQLRASEPDGDLQRESQFVALSSELEGEGDDEPPFNHRGYVVHGPAIYSDEFSARTVDDLSFAFAASGDRDDYKVFGYLLNTADCSQTEVLDSTGEMSLWATVRVAIPSNGTYRFVFVAGTYDQNWGSGAGGILYLDDVLLSPNPERVAAAAAAAAASPAATLAKTGSDLGHLWAVGGFAAVLGATLLGVNRLARKGKS
jgi:hypothetical protein